MVGKVRKYKPLTDLDLLRLINDGVITVDANADVYCNGSKLTKYLEGGRKDRETTKYELVRIYYGKARRAVAVHKLVWMEHTRAAVPEGFEIHHWDEDTTHNAFDNLLCLHSLDHRKFHVSEEVPF